MSTKNKNVANKNKENKGVKKIARELLLSSDVEGTIYGKVVKVLGSCMFTVFGYDGVKRICAIRKIGKKKPRVELDNIVLIGLRDFQEGRGDIVYVYTPEECFQLKKMNEIPRVDETNEENFIVEKEDEEIGFSFDDI